MKRDFTVRMGIRLIQQSYDLDIHNFYDFQDLKYSVVERTFTLRWFRSEREGISASLPTIVTIVFRGVSEFRFLPRDSQKPFTEDSYVCDFGYWTDEDWAEGNVMICDQPKIHDDESINAIQFMSGAIIVIQADSAHASIGD